MDFASPTDSTATLDAGAPMHPCFAALILVLAGFFLLGCMTYVVRVHVETPPQVSRRDVERAIDLIREVSQVGREHETFCRPPNEPLLEVHRHPFTGEPLDRVVFLCKIYHYRQRSPRSQTGVFLTLSPERALLVFWIRDFGHDEETPLTARIRAHLVVRVAETFPERPVRVETERMFPPA